MATEIDIARKLNSHLYVNGFVCGQRYKSVDDAVRDIQSQFNDETEASLGRKVRSIIVNPAYRFKTRNNDTEVSGSASDEECGESS